MSLALRPAESGIAPLRGSRLGLGAVAVGVAAVLATSVAALSIGPVDIGVADVFRELLDGLPLLEIDSGLTATEQAIVDQIRLPRVVLGLMVGATLSVSGAAYQGAFRNPLVDPYLLGIAAGAGLGATIAITESLGDGQGILDPVPLAAFIGAPFFALVLRTSRRDVW